MKAFGLFIELKQKKNSKLPPKKSHFTAPPILNIFLWKFHGLVLGLEWELAELENYISFFVFGYWVLQKKCFLSMKRPKAFIWGIIFFFTMDGVFRILEKTSSESICTRLYLWSFRRKNYFHSCNYFHIFSGHISYARVFKAFFTIHRDKISFSFS